MRRVLVADSVEPDERIAELERLAPVDRVPKERLELIAPGNHQGVAARLLPREYATLRGLLADRPSLLIAVDGVLDPMNLGAILRNAEAAGAGGVILPERRASPITATVVKASSGASEHLRLCRVSGLASAIPEVQRAGVWTVALDVSGQTMAWDFDFTQPVCLVVGGEEGIHRLVRQRCDARVRIPMAGKVDSYNAAAAAAIVLYEVARQRAAAR